MTRYRLPLKGLTKWLNYFFTVPKLLQLFFTYMAEFTTLYSIIAARAQKKPEKTALICGGKKYSYHLLLYCIDRASDMFWRLNVRRNDKVAIALKNSAEFVISYFALSKIGAVSVPLNFLISSPREIEYMLANSHSKGVVTENEFAGNYEKMPERIRGFEFILTVDKSEKTHTRDFWKSLSRAHYYPQTHRERVAPNDVISILYTSGTTGHPKGVLLTHRNLLSNVDAAIKVIEPDGKDVFMCLLPMFHTLAWTANVVLPLYIGAETLVVKNITPPKKWLNEMGREGVTIMIAVPQIYSVLAREARGMKKAFLNYWSFRKLRLCVSGAAPLSVRIKRTFEKTFGVHLLEGYGLTETSPVVSINHPARKKEGSVGQALPGVEIKIIGDENKVLKAGEEGEICVRGPNITAGYYDDEAATKNLFTEDGWLRTGDIGIMDNEGFLFIKDRKKDMIISKGLKIFPAQIEHALNEHPKIAESAVIGIPLPADGNETIKCFCVPKKGERLEKSEVREFIRKNFDPYKRPREIEIIASLPKNTLQKVLKRELLKKELEKRPAPG